MDDNYTGPAHEIPQETPLADVDPAMVFQVRVNYKSGAYSQGWYSKFETTTSKEGDVTAIDLAIAEVHPAAEGEMTFPLAMGVKNIESVWVLQSMTALALYNQSCPAV